MKALIPVLAASLLVPAVPAQITRPPASPLSIVQQQVGLSQITIEYSRPGVKGRQIFGGLVPYGRVWRTGANASTKITLSSDATFDGQPVPAGTYAIYTIPRESSWTFILSTNTSLWGAGGYDEAEDLMRTDVPVRRLAEPVETFTIDLQRFTSEGADLRLRWADVEVSVPVGVESDAIVFRQIEEHVIDAAGEVDANTYFTAASFYAEKDHELEQAAAWMEEAVERQPQAFWMIYARAELAESMGDVALAEEWASRALEAARAADADYGYVARSEMLLEKLRADA